MFPKYIYPQGYNIKEISSRFVHLFKNLMQCFKYHKQLKWDQFSTHLKYKNINSLVHRKS